MNCRSIRWTGSFAAILACVALAGSPALHGQGSSAKDKDAKGSSGSKDAAPPPPDKLWAAQTSPTEIRLEWYQVPGAVAYRVFCAVGPSAARVMGTVGGAAAAALTPGTHRPLSFVVRLANSLVHQCFVEAADGKGRVSTRVPFNEVTPVSKAAVSTTIAPPATVTAAEAGPGQITLTWDEVPGATAYYIGRAVFPNGLQTLCSLCPTGGSYVDRDVTAGAKHTYAVAAVTPAGVSRRTTSNTVTLAGAGAGEAETEPDPGNSAEPLPPKGASNVKAVHTLPGLITISWDPVAGANLVYSILRSIGGGPPVEIAKLASGQRGRYEDRHPGHLEGLIRYGVVVQGPKGAAPAVWSNEIAVAKSAKDPDKDKGPTSSPAARSCTLEYQRADNMWAAPGRPDGGLGVERVTLGAGQAKVFSTDWAYEKRRNDGTNFYGSHLRVARNTGERPVTLHISRQAGNSSTIVLQPGSSQTAAGDLREVVCR